MRGKDPELHDPVLAQELKTALAHEAAPRAWVNRALQIPVLAFEPAPSRALTILPNLFGLCLLVGLGVAWLLRPDISQVVGETVRSGVLTTRGLFPGGVTTEILAAVLLTPVLIYLMYQGSRGFPVLHRH